MKPKQLLAEAQKIWYKKLRESGFEDIEQDSLKLKQSASTLYTSKINGSTYEENIALHDSKREYYRLAGMFLHEHEFITEFERQVWELHSEGTSFREIAKILKNKDVGFKINKDNIQIVIHNLKQDMLKLYRSDNE